jgi:hypothetical protein
VLNKVHRKKRNPKNPSVKIIIAGNCEAESGWLGEMGKAACDREFAEKSTVITQTPPPHITHIRMLGKGTLCK